MEIQQMLNILFEKEREIKLDIYKHMPTAELSLIKNKIEKINIAIIALMELQNLEK